MDIKPVVKHLPLECDSRVILATGLGGITREYPDYEEKFGKDNLVIVKWGKSCTDVDSHLQKMKDNFPKKEPFILCGHSLGGALAIELLNRENIPNLQGVVLIGSSRKIKQDGGLRFIMKFPWFFLWIFAFMFVLAFPITIFFYGKKTLDTYKELFSFLKRDGAKNIHRQYNLTLKKLGTADKVLQPEIPMLYVGLTKDVLVDEDDLEITMALFKESRKQLIEANQIHLTEKFDSIIVEKIAAEAVFLGLTK
ncbi:MAG: hypothetical protein FK730_05005 [Asgard group archaeon]|nr:hypothetical protein [Asgard group archaeon]